MKRIIMWAVCMLATFPCFAQWDIKVFDKIGKDAIIQMLGVPEPEKKFDEYIEDVIVVDYYYSNIYPGTIFALDEDAQQLSSFLTDSPAFCFFSDLIPGGIKVGDSFSKLESIDFVHSAYGQNRELNALKLIDSTTERDYYGAYNNERIQFRFRVRNGIIIGLNMFTLDEDTAIYYNCDITNSPW